MISDSEVCGLWKDDRGECLLRVIGIHRTGGAFNVNTDTDGTRIRLDGVIVKGYLKRDRVYRSVLPKRDISMLMVGIREYREYSLLIVNLRAKGHYGSWRNESKENSGPWGIQEQ